MRTLPILREMKFYPSLVTLVLIHFVKLEALNLCKTAVPIGVVLGIAITWGLCTSLRFLVGGEFSTMPLFQICATDMISGIVLGVVSVLVAASSSAKRAAKVSPITAVSGNSENTKNGNGAVNTCLLKIETALSIILFFELLCFFKFIGCLMPQSSNTSDIDILSNDSSNSIDSVLLDATDEDVEMVRNVVGENSVFHDRCDQRTTSTYFAFILFVYGFLGIITLVTVLNIMNSISMSVSAWIMQYGVMRAVGMDEHQIAKMITAEAVTYALLGCAVGLLISKLLYDRS